MRPSPEELLGLEEIQRELWLQSSRSEPVPSFGQHLTLRATLWCAWQRLRRSKRRTTPGVDGMGIREFEVNLDENLRRLGEAMKHGTYQPKPLRRVEVPKASGGTRWLGIPTIEDRLVQHVLLLFLTPVAHGTLSLTSYACRPGFGTVRALKSVQDGLLARSNKVVIRADVKDFFDEVRHDRLRELLKRRFRGSKVWKTLDAQLNAWAVAPGQGLPQGAPLSPMLANLYLRDVDHRFDCHLRLNYVRYLDDIVLVVRGGMERALQQLAKLQGALGELGLQLNDKTRVAPAEEDFEFLGMTLRRVHAGKVDVRMPAKTLLRLRQCIDESTASTRPGELDQLEQAMQSWQAHYVPFDRRSFEAIKDHYYQRTGRRCYPNHPSKNSPGRLPGWMGLGRRNGYQDHSQNTHHQYSKHVGLPPSASAATSSFVGGVAQPRSPDSLPGWHAGSALSYASLMGDIRGLGLPDLELALNDTQLVLQLLGRALASVQQDIYESRARRSLIRRSLQNLLCQQDDFEPRRVDVEADRNVDYVAALTHEHELSARASTLEVEIAAMKTLMLQLSAQIADFSRRPAKRRTTRVDPVSCPGLYPSHAAFDAARLRRAEAHHSYATTSGCFSP